MSILSILAVALALGQVPEPTGPLVKSYTGFVYTEGPAFDRDGNLYFTDQRDGRGKIYKITSGKWVRNDAGTNPSPNASAARVGVEGIEFFVASSGRANGLAVSNEGEIVACQMDGRIVAYRPDGSYRVVAARYHGRRFNAPNDLVLDRHGGIYFTDPRINAPLLPPQDRAAVYYVAADGCVTRLIDDLRLPNGITLSPDEKTLYVAASLERCVMAYPVLGPGKIGAGRCCARISPGKALLFVGGDGIKTDAAGNLYVATARGIQIFDPCGTLLHIICVPERPSNLAFGGPNRRTLIITAGGSIYSIRMSIAGPELGD
ncbi:MAG: SMP-30/gluconolactonase/LRE family protein [Gemmataceae bacterium]|nr:SMP-30/gluconolactonase/LRE family protein [Gemmataceae bacterium]